MDLKKYVVTVNDFPKPGVKFKDITPLVNDAKAFKTAILKLEEQVRHLNVDIVLSPESRGFLFGCPLANKLGVGFAPVRKRGKLPRETIEQSYSLEYGTDYLAVHKDAIKPGQKVLIVDDILATGGTALAIAKMVEKLKGEVVGFSFLIELVDLKGRKTIEKYPVFTLIEE